MTIKIELTDDEYAACRTAIGMHIRAKKCFFGLDLSSEEIKNLNSIAVKFGIAKEEEEEK